MSSVGIAGRRVTNKTDSEFSFVQEWTYKMAGLWKANVKLSSSKQCPREAAFGRMWTNFFLLVIELAIKRTDRSGTAVKKASLGLRKRYQTAQEEIISHDLNIGRPRGDAVVGVAPMTRGDPKQLELLIQCVLVGRQVFARSLPPQLGGENRRLLKVYMNAGRPHTLMLLFLFLNS